MNLHFSAEGMTTYNCVQLESAFFSTTFKLSRFTNKAKIPKPHVISPLHLHSFCFIIASEFHETCWLLTGGCDLLSCCIRGMCLCLCSPEVPAPANRLGLPRTSPPACRHSHRRSHKGERRNPKCFQMRWSIVNITTSVIDIIVMTLRHFVQCFWN